MKVTNAFFLETNASISCIPLRTTHLSWPITKKNLDSIHGRSSSCFKDKLWFQTKRRLQVLFLGNQCINIVYPNENYPFVLSHREKKLNSIHGWSSTRFKDKLWFQTKWRLPMLSSWNQRINIVYPNENYPFFMAPYQKSDKKSEQYLKKMWTVQKKREKKEENMKSHCY